MHCLFARRGLKAVEKLHKCTSAVLARKMSENDICDIRVVYLLVDETNAGVMTNYNCIAATGSYILDDTIGIVI